MKFRMFLAALVATIMGAVGLAVPAQASSYAQCGDGWICFYNYESFNTAGGVWGHRIYGAGNWNTCITMPSSGLAVWPGGTAYNKATSIVINNGGNSLEIHAHFYDGYDCTGWPQMFGEYTLPTELDLDMWRLANYSAYPSGNANDRIGSFKLNGNPTQG